MSEAVSATPPRNRWTTMAAWRAVFRDRPIVPLLGLLGLLVIISQIARPGIVTADWASVMIRTAVPLAILAGCQTLTMLTGGIDLSVGAVGSMAGFMVASLVATQGLGVGFAVAIIGAILAGLATGIGVGVFRVHPLIMTLGMGLVVLGLANVWQLQSVQTSTGVPPVVRSLGSARLFDLIPYNLAVFVPIALLVLVGLRRTGYGRLLFAVGANPVATRLSGTRSWQVLIVLYVISALMAAAAGILVSGLTNVASVTLVDSLVLPSVAAAVIGGTSIMGGRGGYGGTIVGALILTLISSLLTSLGLPEALRQVLFGAIIVLVAAAYRRVTNESLMDSRDGAGVVAGRLVLDDTVAGGRITIEDGLIAAVELAADVPNDSPYVAPGFVDVHVHGWGGHDAMGDRAALDGMARALLRRGVTSFLPTAVSAPLGDLAAFAERVRAWMPNAPGDGAAPLGFDLEGPFLAPGRRGAHDPAHLRNPADVSEAELEPLVEGLRLITIAPELAGATDLIAWFRDRGAAVSIGHSAATVVEAQSGYDAGATSTTHLFNAMSGFDHRAPGVAVAALLDDRVFVELIADGLHVDRALWPLIARLKPADRLLLVSDAIALAGMGDGQGWIGGLAVEVVGGRVTLAGTSTLAGSVLSLDVAVRNLVASGISVPAAVAAASRNPLALLGVTDRGRIVAGQRADLVELDADLQVRRVMWDGTWLAGGAGV